MILQVVTACVRRLERRSWLGRGLLIAALVGPIGSIVAIVWGMTPAT